MVVNKKKVSSARLAVEKSDKFADNYHNWSKLVGEKGDIGVYFLYPSLESIHFENKTGIPFDNNIDYSCNDIDENILDKYRDIHLKYYIDEIKSETNYDYEEDEIKLAEYRRYKFLNDLKISESEKKKILEMGNFIKYKIFWLNNFYIKNNIFVAEKIVDEYMKLYNLREKHYRTLAATATVQDKNTAREEILSQVKKNTFIFKEVSFPNYDPYQQVAEDNEEMEEQTRLAKYALYREEFKRNDRG